MWMKMLLLASLRARWLEYLSAGAVVAAAVAAVVGVGVVVSSGEKQVHELAHNLGRNMLIVSAETDLSDFYAFRYRGGGMPDSYPDRIRFSPLGKHIRSMQALLYGNARSGGADLIVVGMKSYQGGGPGASPPEGEAILGPSVSERLGFGKDDELNIEGVRLRVADVAPRPPDGLDMGVFTSLLDSQSIMERPGEINAIRAAGCWCSIDVAALASQVERLLPGTKAVTVAGVIKAQKGAVAAARKYSALIKMAAAFLIAGITALLISSQVRRERREIGLLLASGTPPRFVGGILVFKAGLLGFSGAVAGWLLAVLALEFGLGDILGPLDPAAGAWKRLPAIAALSTGVAAAGALVPAFKAARLDPIEALREV